MYLSYTEMSIRFLITLVVVFLIGWNREKRHKSAGLTTHTILALSTCALSIFQVELMHTNIALLAENPSLIGSVSIENQRLIAQVLTGMGFIGAGAIFKSQNQITGITTAATLWVSGVIGLIIGFGYYALGITLGVITVLVINIVKTYIGGGIK